MKKFLTILIATCACAVTLNAQQRYVDYRFAPQWQESTTAFPDDSCKTLVGPLGQLLYDFGGEFFPYSLGKGFSTVIHMMADENQKFESTSLMSARVPIVIVRSSMLENEIEQKIFSSSADIRKGTEETGREDVVYTTYRNNSDREAVIRPIVVVNSEHVVSVEGRTVTIDHECHFTVSLNPVRVRTNLADFKTLIELEPVSVAPHSEYTLAGIYDNGVPSSLSGRLLSAPVKALELLEQNCGEVREYWESGSSVPYGCITVPDKEIQNLIDASVRGIWQAREIKDGNISLQVGPTCYRGLWVVDGAFLSEVSAMLGRGVDARAGIEYTLSFQKESGEFAKLSKTFWKENGLVLWTCVRHAMMTQDKQWLLSKWETLSKTVDFIHELRVRTYLNDIPEDDGLIPPGYIDGGLNGGTDMPDYSNTLWNLVGMKSMIEAARWIDRIEDAERWQSEYDDFFDTFRRAADRDMATDDFGNRYLNVMMRPEHRSLPQRAQWTFCQSIYPGQIFDMDDPIVTGTMDMLETTLQEGCVMGTGWIVEGIWNYFPSFYGHALLWTGDGDKAASSLYSFANHASTLYSWREEHNPRDLQPSEYVGDMPHNWGSAEFIRLAVHLLEIDRGNELHLLEGIPVEWLGAGMHTELKKVATPFGPLSFTLDVDRRGRTATLVIDALKENCEAIVVHSGDWGSIDGSSMAFLDPLKKNSIKINLK